MAITLCEVSFQGDEILAPPSLRNITLTMTAFKIGEDLLFLYILLLELQVHSWNFKFPKYILFFFRMLSF